MEINLNNNNIGNFGIGLGALDTQGVDAAHGAKSTKKADMATFTITEAVASPEDISAAAIPESELSRDDDLGKLVSAAFNLPPPPMPDFNAV
jgi:hypothetical protein